MLTRLLSTVTLFIMIHTISLGAICQYPGGFFLKIFKKSKEEISKLVIWSGAAAARMALAVVKIWAFLREVRGILPPQRQSGDKEKRGTGLRGEVIVVDFAKNQYLPSS